MRFGCLCGLILSFSQMNDLLVNIPLPAIVVECAEFEERKVSSGGKSAVVVNMLLWLL